MIEISADKIRKTIYFVTGILLYAIALNLFFVENQIAAGGFAGIATVVNYVIPIKIGVFLLVMNIPLFLVSGKLKGVKYTALTLALAVVYSTLVDALAFLPTATTNKFVAAIFGGLLYGIGSACIAKANVSAGGTDLLAKLLLVRFKNISLGKMYLCLDGFVVIMAILVYRDLEAGLYSISAIYTCAIITDKLINGFNNASICTIITNEDAEVISAPITQQTAHGVTCYYGMGMYEKKTKNVLVVVVRPHEVPKIKQIVMVADPRAFIVVGNASEVIGNGFENLNETNTSTLKYQKMIAAMRNESSIQCDVETKLRLMR